MPTYNNALTNQPANRLAYPGGLAKRGGSLDSFVPLDYSRLAAGQFRQDTPQMREYAANVPVDVMRGRLAGMLGFPSDVLNMFRTPSPMEMFGQTDYEQPTQVPYGSEQFLKTLPLAPAENNPLGRVANRAGSLVPFTPMEALQAARMARQAAMATGKFVAPKAAQLTEGYMQRMGMMPSIVPVEGASVASAANVVSPEVASANQLAAFTRPKVEVSPLGFYSAVEQQALNIPRKSGTGASFINDLMKGQDVKKYEIEAMGLDEFLQGKPNVSREEVQNFIANNRIDVQEKMLGGNQAPSQDLLSWMNSRNIMKPRNPEGWQELSQKLESYAQQHQRAQGAPEASQRYFTLSEEAGRISEGLDAGGSAAGATKYDRFQLPGGENYREILLTLPNQWDKPRAAQVANEARIKALRQEMHGTSGTDEIRGEISRLQNENTALQQQIREAPIYKSSHFDEPNVLAHMRVNDRIDADGKKMLLVEEVQSDWHQAGREKGYQGKGTLKELPDNYFVQEIKTIDGDTMYVVRDNNNPGVVLNKDYNKQSAINGVINELNATSAGGVPDAPFKDTWHQLALKRALKEAVDKGYDRIGLTTGKQQIDRFSDQLRQNVDEINFNPIGTQNEIFVNAKKNGQNTFSGTIKDGKFIDGSAAGKTVEEVLGKTMAKQIAEKKDGVIKGDDLTIGGEGMKKYYDEIYPAFLEKQGKKYGAKMGETQIGLPPKTSSSWAYFRDWFAENHSNVGSGSTALSNWEQGSNNKYVKEFEKFRKTPSQVEKVRYLDITPEMRDAIKKGQPLASMQNELANRLA